MDSHDDNILCFSALTWNLELLCTLSYNSVSMAIEFPSCDAYRKFVTRFLSAFERAMIRVVCQRHCCDLPPHLAAAVSQVHVDEDAAACTCCLCDIAFLREMLPVFRTNVCRALKEGDARRRSAQHVARNIFLSGRYVATQPLLLEYLDIARVVQAYAGADLAKNAVSSFFVSSNRMTWEPLEWPDVTPCGCYTRDDYESRGSLYRAKLPITGRWIVKCVLAAVDDDAYNLSRHFRDDVFAFMDGSLRLTVSDFVNGAPEVCAGGASPIKPTFMRVMPGFWGRKSDSAERPIALSCHSSSTLSDAQHKQHVTSVRTLVHCSAGMHRSAALVIAFLMRCSVAAGDPVDAVTGQPMTVDEWCTFVQSRRSVAMPTPFAVDHLRRFLEELRRK